MPGGVVVAEAFVGQLLIFRKGFIPAVAVVAVFLVPQRGGDLNRVQGVDPDIGAQV